MDMFRNFGFDPRERSFGHSWIRDFSHAYGHFGRGINNNYH